MYVGGELSFSAVFINTPHPLNALISYSLVDSNNEQIVITHKGGRRYSTSFQWCAEARRCNEVILCQVGCLEQG